MSSLSLPYHIGLPLSPSMTKVLESAAFSFVLNRCHLVVVFLGTCMGEQAYEKYPGVLSE